MDGPTTKDVTSMLFTPYFHQLSRNHKHRVMLLVINGRLYGSFTFAAAAGTCTDADIAIVMYYCCCYMITIISFIANYKN